MASEKPPVIEFLYDAYLRGDFPDGVVRSEDVRAAITKTGAKLGKANQANFLKDIIRKDTANDNWPRRLAADRITARQRYGDRKVFQFVPFRPGQTEPFPDPFLPTEDTPFHPVQSATVPFAARQLGRKEESWLMQVVVSLRVIETQLAVFSPLRQRLRDITHLQMSMKTQPEIDAVYLVGHSTTRDLSSGRDLFSVVTCEAKQLGERILIDQIREQVARAFKETKELSQPRIQSVKPMAVQVRKAQMPNGIARAIYVVEFQRIPRKLFETRYEATKAEPERLYAMPLKHVSSAFHILTPAVRGVNL